MSNPAFDLIDLDLLRQNPLFATIDGSEVGVAVLDSGIDAAHPQLHENVRQVVDFARPTDHPQYGQDEQGHGTHVAGTIASTNPEIGVAPDADLIALKVGGLSGSAGLSTRAIESALQWVLQNRQTYNILVVNMSFGIGFYSNPDDSALQMYPYLDEVQALTRAGVTVVSAAGNEYDGNLRSGSSAPGIFSTLDVGAVYDENEGPRGYTSWRTGEFIGDRSTASDRHAYFSHRPNTGNGIFAPGTSITSTFPGNSLADFPGTSMASPHVSGVVALMQEAALTFGGRYLAPNEVRNLLISTADPIIDGDDEDTTVPVTQQSYPRLNANHAVQAIQNLFASSPASVSQLLKLQSSANTGVTDLGMNQGTQISATLITSRTQLGTPKSDRLVGDWENDLLIGKAGNDRLLGQSGNDVLMGGQGEDWLRGGEGFDRFQLNLSRNGADKIVDFSTAFDTIVLSAPSLKRTLSAGVLQRDRFHLGKTAADHNDRLIYQKRTGALWFDPDGIGAASPMQLAQLSRGTGLSHADILIV